MRLPKFRRQHQAFLVEGADLVAAGLASGCRPQAVFVVDGSISEAEVGALSSPGYVPPLTAVTRRVAEKLRGQVEEGLCAGHSSHSSGASSRTHSSTTTGH